MPIFASSIFLPLERSLVVDLNWGQIPKKICEKNDFCKNSTVMTPGSQLSMNVCPGLETATMPRWQLVA